MAQSELLDIMQAASNQANLHTTINDIIEAFEHATQRFLEVDLGGYNGQYPFDTEDFTRRVAFRFINASETGEIYFPSSVNGNDSNRVLFVANACGETITFVSTDETLATTGLTVELADGETAILIIERDNIYSLVGSATLTAEQIIALIDAELGSDDWQTGGGGGGDTFWIFSMFERDIADSEPCVWSWTAPMDVTFQNDFTGSFGRSFNVPDPSPLTFTLIADRAAGNSVIGSFTLTSTGSSGSCTFADSNPGTGLSLAAGDRLRVIAPATINNNTIKLSLAIYADRD